MYKSPNKTLVYIISSHKCASIRYDLLTNIPKKY